MTTTVQTVLGPVEASELGRVLPHEHLLSLTPGPWMSSADPDNPSQRDDDLVAAAVRALSAVHSFGIGCVVDLSPYGVVGRSADGGNVELLARVSRESGIHIVAGTSTYLPAFSPSWVATADVEALTKRFVSDIESGIADSGIRAGVLGEQATGLDRIDPLEERALRAAVRASMATGRSLMTHTTHATMAAEQTAIVLAEGGDLSRLTIGHMDIAADLDPLLRILDTGAGIAFDTIGKQHWDFFLAPISSDQYEGEYAKRAFFRSDATRARHLVELVNRGYTGQILLSHDLTGAEVSLNPTTHGHWGLRFLHAVFLPSCIELGMPEAAVDQLTRDNPARVLAGVHA